MKPKVLITRKIPQEIVEKISSVCDVDMWNEEEVPIPREVLEQKIVDVEGLFCLITEKIDADLLKKAKNLKVVSNMAVGYNNIDIEACRERGITVTNTPGVLTETTADLTFALLMATARRLIEASTYLRNGEWKTWSPMQLTGQDVYGATIGIIGMGRIGEAVARRAKAFDMNILYHNRNRKVDAEKTLGATYVELDELLKQSDFVVIMTPYTPETVNLISERELSLMKKTAVLINTARGGIVNEEALYNALKTGQIWAAGLDVFAIEPVSLDHPLLTLPNVVALPHIGSASIKTRLKMAELAADNLMKGVTNQRPDHVVV
ncbi:2-hydroxyacid dehydrogenase [Calidifontibacillus erzurumensis]|uniref:D-glycerate dehydrogenase n=1 Tax=Calidifontibacillus erzurumensis TaxID=2741433 RepID=A0A8J8KEK6_9BACI|nr:D-glycerate dehydrogenase [Calidifontibacillus erzurumensis]NSL51925.1 D-glycerate dehydrogenase [Calidifontibacillus erzurumensis]